MKLMKAIRFAVCCAIAGLVVVGPSLLRSQTTKPAVSAAAALELRATQSFNRGEYALALPMLQKVAESLKDQPDRLSIVEEQIRLCQKNIANPPKPALAAVTAADPLGVSPPAAATQVATGDDRKAHPAPKDGQIVALEIKELGNFDYDAAKGGNIPVDVKRLSGAKIRTHGYMIPLDQAENISEFALVPSLFACCFGQPPQIQHTIVVHCPKGKAVSYYQDEITVEGKLTVDEKKDDGYIVSVFELEASSVRPAAK